MHIFTFKTFIFKIVPNAPNIATVLSLLFKLLPILL